MARAVASTQAGSPKGWPLTTALRTAANSAALRGVCTKARQYAGRASAA